MDNKESLTRKPERSFLNHVRPIVSGEGHPTRDEIDSLPEPRSARDAFPLADTGERLPDSWQESTEKKREILASDRPILYGRREIQPSEVNFLYSVSRQDDRLQFIMESWIPTDEVFGMEAGRENDLTVFLYYDLASGEICDTLDVKVFGDDGSKEYYPYLLSGEEKATLLSKAGAYCQEQTGMSLARHRKRYQEERDRRGVPNFDCVAGFETAGPESARTRATKSGGEIGKSEEGHGPKPRRRAEKGKKPGAPQR